jgi:hypothetical protein
MTLRAVASLLTSLLFGAVGFVACGGHTSSSNAPSGDGGAGDDASQMGDDASSNDSSTGDASSEASNTDGTPTRRQCTSTFGNALDTSFGRLDGYLVAIVPPNQRGCNGDNAHVHLQILMKGAVYDAAVNVDGEFHQQDLKAPGAPWSEGWHTGLSDYYANLGVHSNAFTQSTVAQLAPVVEQALANANHISVWATGYGPTGVHLVHYHGGFSDGMVIVDPLSPTSHALMFAFQGDTF